MAYKIYDPFRLNSWVGTALGVIGKTQLWDENFRLRGDVDACLRSLKNERVIFQDMRFHFLSMGRFKNRGGSATFRSQEKDHEERRLLSERWGRFINFKAMTHNFAKNRKIKAATTLSPYVRVKRRQK